MENKDKKTCGILSFERFHGRRNVGSSRIRGHWMMKYFPESEDFIMGKEYDTVIYQKAYFPEHAREFDGVKVLDICDPDFLHFVYKFKEMIEEVDAVVTSTDALKDAIQAFTKKPVLCIPDRLDLEYHTEKRNHKGQGRAKTVVWFGYSTGFNLLRACLEQIRKLELNLIVISDSGFTLSPDYMLPNKDFYPDEKSYQEALKNEDRFYIEVTNYPWKLETVNADIVRGDIVINPRSSKGKWKYKSNNKTLSAWALGMPVAHNTDELKKFLGEESRIQESEKRLKEIEEKWDIKISVSEYKELIGRLKENKAEKSKTLVRDDKDYLWFCPRSSCKAIILKTKKPFLMDGMFKCKSCNHAFNVDELMKFNIKNLRSLVEQQSKT